MSETKTKFLREWFDPVNLLAAALFCLVLGFFLGAKIVAAGHVLLVTGFFMMMAKPGSREIEWSRVPASGWWLAGFLVVAVISVIANRTLIEAPLGHLKHLRYLLIPLLLLLVPALSREIGKKPWRRDALVVAWLVSMGLAIVVGFITWRSGVHPFRYIDPIYTWRLSGFLGHTMTFSYTLQFSVVALAGFVLVPRVWKEVTRVPWWIALVSLVIACGATYLTYTRGAMLGVLVGFVTIALLRSFKLILVLLVIGIAAGAYAYSEGTRYFYLEDPVRVNQWKAAAMSFLERPTAGLGFRNFEHHSVALKERYGFEMDTEDLEGNPIFFRGHAHNNFLEAFVSTGVFGGIALLGFCFCWLGESLRSRYALIFVPLIVTFVVSGLFENTFFDSEVLNCILVIYLFSQWTRREKDDPLAPAGT